MKISTLSLFLILILGCQKSLTGDQKRNNAKIETEPPIFGIVLNSPTEDVHGYFVAKPALYDSTTKKYPLLISIHTGEAIGNGGSDLPKVLTQGVPKLVSEGKFPANFMVNGENFSFIIIAPQFSTFSQTPAIQKFIAYAENKYRIDTRRIYLTGMSMGAAASWNFAIDYNNVITAVVPMSGIVTAEDGYAKRVAKSGVPVWYFHNKSDSIFSIDTAEALIHKAYAFRTVAELRFTEGYGGHDSWTKACNPEFEEEDHINIYQWMLKFHK